MARVCKYPGCTTPLNHCVPSHITFCGDHQYQLAKIKAKLASENLPEEALLFIETHLQGCTGRELYRHLGKSRTSFYQYLRGGKIKASKCGRNPRYWIIPQTEIIRVIILVLNYISVYLAARSIGASPDHFSLHAKVGHFGPTRRNFRGWLSIKKRPIPELKAQYEALKAKSKSRANRVFKSHLKEGEVSPRQIADRITGKSKISILTVHSWVRKGWLPHERRGFLIVINEEDLAEFARKALAKEDDIEVDPRFFQAFFEIVSQSPSQVV